MSPDPINRDLFPRDSIRSKNRSVNKVESFLSPSAVLNMQPKNNRHSIYRNELNHVSREILNGKICNYKNDKELRDLISNDLL